MPEHENLKDVKRHDPPKPKNLDEDLRRLELSQFRVLILKYPQETQKIFKEMQMKTA